MNKFKEGDKVKVVSVHNWQKQTRERGSYSFQESIGQTGVVYSYGLDLKIVYVELDNRFTFYYHEDDLELLIPSQSELDDMRKEVERLQKLIDEKESAIKESRKIKIEEIVPFAVFEFNKSEKYCDTAIVIPVYDNYFILAGNTFGNGLWDIGDQPYYTDEQLVKKLNRLKAVRTNKIMKVTVK